MNGSTLRATTGRPAVRRACALLLVLAASSASGEPGAGLEAPRPSLEAPRPALATLQPAPDVSAFRDAVSAYRRGDVPAGDRVRATLGVSTAGTLLDWAAIRLGGAAIPFERVAAFTRAEPDWPGGSGLRRRAEEALLAERASPERIRAFFARARPQTAAGKMALAEAFRADGLDGDAAALVRDAWRNDSFGRDTEARLLGLYPAALTAADHRFRAERFAFKESWDAARRAAGYAGRDDEALLKARIAVAAKAATAGKLLDAVPAAARGEPSYVFSRAQWLRRQDRTAEAAKLLGEVTRDPALLVDGDEWWAERRVVARKLLDEGDPRTAYAVASAGGAVTPEKQVEAAFHAGWIALRFLKDPALATPHLERMAAIAATPTSLARAAYWRGRAAEAAGEGAAAAGFFADAARYPTAYYGQLAAARVGTGEVRLRPVSLVDAEPVDAAGARLVEAVQLLFDAGARDLAVPLTLELARASRDPSLLAAVGDVVLAQGDARTLLLLGKAATGRGLPLDRHAFPTIGVPSFEPAAGPAVETALVYAITRQESAFDPAAGSGVGARGLMQLMPGTAQAVARRFGIDYDPDRLLEGAYNARLGAAHLGELMNDWKGSYVLTFASYNAGPGNAKKWVAQYGDPRDPAVDPVDWVERIPFSETRNYVQRVMENLQVYRKRLDSRSALLIEGDLRRRAVPTP